MPLRLFAVVRTHVGIATFLICVALLCMPAVLNRYPLFYPDSIGYVRFGPTVANALFRGHISESYGYRSAWYNLSILPLHWMSTAWPIVIFHAMLTVYVLRRTLARVVPALTRRGELAIFLALAAATSAGWYVSLVQPDFLTPLAILCTFLLATGWRILGRVHRAGVCAVLWYAIVSHNSHLPLALGLLGVALIWHLLCRAPWRDLAVHVGPITAVIALAITSQLAIHIPLHGRASLFGKGLPFMTGRMIVDGPGADYLREHCHEHDWAICRYLDRLPPPDLRHFLWEPSGIWQTADDATRDRLRAEEGAFVAAVLRTYPWRQAKATMANIRSQAMHFDLWTFRSHPQVNEVIRERIPGMADGYFQARQAQDAMNMKLVSTICRRTVYLSGLILPVLLIVRWRRSGRPTVLLGLTLFVLLGIAGNLALGAGLSVATDRLHARAIWLVPLLAMLCAAAILCDERPHDSTS